MDQINQLNNSIKIKNSANFKQVININNSINTITTIQKINKHHKINNYDPYSFVNFMIYKKKILKAKKKIVLQKSKIGENIDIDDINTNTIKIIYNEAFNSKLFDRCKNKYNHLIPHKKRILLNNYLFKFQKYNSLLKFLSKYKYYKIKTIDNSKIKYNVQEIQALLIKYYHIKNHKINKTKFYKINLNISHKNKIIKHTKKNLKKYNKFYNTKSLFKFCYTNWSKSDYKNYLKKIYFLQKKQLKKSLINQIKIKINKKHSNIHNYLQIIKIKNIQLYYEQKHFLQNVNITNVYVKSSLNNIFITFVRYNRILTKSMSMAGFKGKKMKTTYGYKKFIEIIVLALYKFVNSDHIYINIYTKNFPRKFNQLFRIFRLNNIKIHNIYDITPIPYNGCKKRKISIKKKRKSVIKYLSY